MKRTNRTAKYPKGKEKVQKIGNYMTTYEDELHKEKEHEHPSISSVYWKLKGQKAVKGNKEYKRENVTYWELQTLIPDETPLMTPPK